MNSTLLAAALSCSAAAFAQEAWLPLPDGLVERSAFGSCAKHWQSQPIWDGSIAQKPDLIESIHDGTFFHDKVKLFVFLPTGVVLLVLWLTGIYLFVLPYLVRGKRRQTAKVSAEGEPVDRS